LKPENLFVTQDGRVKILDFGLAKLTQRGEGSVATNLPTAPAGTEPGVVLGTLGYMSPEQVAGRPADVRSDIFSFGAILYEMLSGRRAFQANSAAETMSAILREDPPQLSTTVPNVSPRLDHIVRHCLENNPEQRFHSAHDIAFDLEEAGGAEAAPRPILPGRRRWALPVLAALLAVIAATSLALWIGRSRSLPSPPVRFAIPSPAGKDFEGMLAVSPAGDRLALVAPDREGRRLLWIRSLGSFSADPVAGSEDASFPFWSPDGHQIAFFAAGKLKRLRLSGGSPEIVCAARDPRGGTWGASDEIVFSTDAGSSIVRVPAAGGGPQPLVTIDPKRGEGTIRWPTLLPDGRSLLFYVLSSQPGKSGVYAGRLGSSERRFVAIADSGAQFSAGWLVFRRGSSLVAQQFDPGSARVSGEAQILTEDVWWNCWAPGWTAFSASAGGVLAYQTGGVAQTRLAWFDRTGRELGTVGEPGCYGELALSHDGKRLLTVRADAATAAGDVWEFDLARGAPERLTTGPTNEDTPVYSPDDTHIGYSTYPDNRMYSQARDSGKRELLFEASGFPEFDDWPTGGPIVFTKVDLVGDHTSLWLLDGPGRARPFTGTAFNEEGAQVSPDGHWVAYSSDETSQPEIYLRRFPGGEEKRLVSSGGGTQAKWKGDGTELFYVAPDGRLFAVPVRTAGPVAVGRPAALFRSAIATRIEARNEYVVSADGTRFLVNSKLDRSAPVAVVLNWATERKTR
jgi:Tol biopolymer transport system component